MGQWEEGGPPQRSWWGRNWKGAAPAGGLGMLLSCGCLGALIVGATWFSVQSTGVYGDALAAARQSPEVREALGDDVDTGLGFKGSINTGGNGGSASFRVPLKGSKGQGTLRADARKEGEQWRFRVLQVEVPGRPPID